MTMTRGRRLSTGLLAAVVLLSACGDGEHANSLHAAAPRGTPGPIDREFEGLAYPVPTGKDPIHPDAVPVTLEDSGGHIVGTDFAPAGTALRVRSVDGQPKRVAMPWRPGVTAFGLRASFWSMPSFVQLKDMTVTINGVAVPLGESGLRYHRGSVATFRNSTGSFDALIASNRQFLACRVDTWGIGAQTFAVDLVEEGLHRHDRTTLDLGVQAIDWGVKVPINGQGIHELHRSCDGKTVADFGYTHHTTQWLEALGRTVYLLAASPWAGEYRAKIDAYRRRIDQIATILTRPAVKAYWVRHVKDAPFGNDFTHRTFMRAAGFGLASTLTDNPRDAARWAGDAREIAQRGIDDQLPSGVNPERGGFDVLYQMYGTWLAELYLSTLGPSSDIRRPMERTIERAVEWMTTRINRTTGQIKIQGTTRICVESLWTTGAPAPFVDPAETIRAFLLWGHLRSQPRLIDLAILVDAGQKQFGNRCPRDYRAPPEQPR